MTKLLTSKLPVAVDGNWGQWGDYGTCSKSCDGGRKQRKRQCDDPPASNGGKKCEGLPYEETSCNTNACDGKYSL